MGYVDENLMAGEKVIHRAELHWALFLKSIVLVILGLLFMGAGDVGATFGGILIVLGLILGIPAFTSYSTSEFAVTDKRLIVKVGFIKRDTLELLLAKVEAIHVHQDILGRVLGYGTVIITGTGGSKDPFHKISDPMQFRKHAQEQIAIVQS